MLFAYLYVMITILLYLVFIVSVALAAGGIILATRLRSRNRSDAFTYLLYFQVFIYTFGFYVIWGQVLIRTLLSQQVSEAALGKISDVSVLLGLPFLVFAWLMLLRFTMSLTGRKTGGAFIFWFLFANFSILSAIGYFIAVSDGLKTTAVIRYYYIIMNLAYYFIAAFILHFSPERKLITNTSSKKVLAPAIFLIMTAQCIPLFFYKGQELLGAIFALVFFIGNTFIPFYFSYGTMTPDIPAYDITYEEFCRKYEISPRESDIIREICNGLSNKEISERLFITLQTVKDHTHRIYIKTNVKSRVQLINLVKEITIR